MSVRVRLGLPMLMSYCSYETVYTNRAWAVGDEMDFSMIFGKATFKLIEKAKEYLTWRSGRLELRLARRGDNWVWNHVVIDAEAICKVTFV